MPVLWFLKRAVIEAPFVVLAFLLPIFGTDPRTDFLGLSVSVEGTLAGWNILAKGTLGVLISPDPGRDHRAGGPAAGPADAAGARRR